MKKYLLLFSMALMTIACSLDGPGFDSENPEGKTHKVQLYGEINQQPATKVTTDGFCVGDQVGVYIVNYDGETPGSLLVEENQADNVRFTYDDTGNWVSDYDVFYKDNDTKVDFYGYYPYASPSSIEDYFFEVARDQSKLPENGQMAPYEASDFLWAKTPKVTPTESKVILSFYHKMSSARVRFSQGEGWTDAAEFAAVKKEVLVSSTIRQSTIDLSTGVVTPKGEAPLTGIVPMNDSGEFRAIVVPQTVPAGKEVLVITIDGSPKQYIRDVDTEYLPGKITTFDIAIKKSDVAGEYEVELTGVSITAWEADNISHGEEAQEYVIVHNAIAGGLQRTIEARLEMDPTKIKNLKLTGTIDERDYEYMNKKLTSLQRLNLKEVESYVNDPNGDYLGVPPSAFSGKKTLAKCILPENIERISSDAFSSTPLSGTIILPEGLKSVAGFKYTNISNIHFPSTLEEIGDNAFERCTSLMCEIKFPKDIKRIGSYAFSYAAISGNLVLPDNLEKIDQNAFSGCSNLSGSLSVPSKIKAISGKAFNSCGFTGILTLPEGLEIIAFEAFYDVKFKGELNIPKSVLTIGSKAFYGTYFNGNLVLPSGLISLGDGAFQNCWRLNGIVEIPSGVVAIPQNLFSGCTGIEGVRLHKDIEVIGANAFNNCTGIYSIVCEAKNPPIINANSFNGVAKDNFTVEVPEASVNLYKNANHWGEFKRIAAHRDFSISRNLMRTLNKEHSKMFTLRAPSGENWSIESKPDWVEVSPSSGTGKMDVTITVKELSKGSGKRSGDVVFLLDGKNYRSSMTVEQYDYQYGDGDKITLLEKQKGNGVNIVIMGDCFDAKDISEGKYLQAMQDAYSYFFDIEPYLTYKDYFNVYGVFGMSADSGMGTVNTIRESRFGSQYTLNGGVSLNFETTFAAACLAPINDDVSTTLVIMIENSSEYSGLCYMWGDGSAVAVVPMSTDPAPYDFRGLIHHEAGGHGFGKLADEYIYHNAFIEACTCFCCGHIDEVETMKSYGFYDNISLTGDMKSVPWSHMIYDPQYSNTVDVYEGAFFHSRGVFRSEPTSCMHNNIPYYNAISREAMVKRIMKYAGEEYSFTAFKANDKESLPALMSTKNIESSSNSSSRFDQKPPKFMGEKPIFRNTDF